MSGGVDSSVAAARLVEQGHQVVGATLKLWGGASDSGCCSVADVDDARRVAQQLGVPHYVFDMTEAFHASVVDPYVAAHAAARTPNPCVECNRHIKFDLLLERADRLGFDFLATGHHARVAPGEAGDPHQLRRGADPDKDQSYVLSMLGQEQLSRVILPIGDLTKREVRAHAAALGLRTAAKPDSQDVCFIRSDEGRQRSRHSNWSRWGSDAASRTGPTGPGATSHWSTPARAPCSSVGPRTSPRGRCRSSTAR
jgi:tRNA-specific 2-thiouridylase